jgi:hypothetical protein
MGDDFDRLLATALTPPERQPDRPFVARVALRVRLEEQLTKQRRAVVGRLIKQLCAVAAVGASVWWFSQATAVADWLARSPAIGLAILLAGFGLLVAVIGSDEGSDSSS